MVDANNKREAGLHFHVQTEYISTGCNTVRMILDWGSNDLIVYGSSNCVIVQNANFKKGTHYSSVNFLVLHSGEARIICVRWVKKYSVDSDSQLVAASSDGFVFIWKQNDPVTFERTGSFKAHSDVISAIAAVSINCPYSDLVIATACVFENSVKIWKRKLSGDIICTDSYQYDDLNYCCCLMFTVVPESGILLACGMQNRNLHLYTADFSNFNSDKDLFELSKIMETSHKDWITSLDFSYVEANSNVILATSSLDGFVKIWHITPIETRQQATIKLGDVYFDIRLEMTLRGHTGGVYEVHFSSEIDESGYCKLLSASEDSNIILWKIHSKMLESGTIDACVGKSSFDNIGFTGAAFNPEGTGFVAYDNQGNLFMWTRVSNGSTAWLPQTVGSGHINCVSDIQWDPQGQFLVSVGEDKSVRVHCPRRGYSSRDGRGMVWAEFARPQLHGHPMTRVAVLPNCCFVSASDENILRSFIAPRNFVDNCRKCSYLDVNSDRFKHYTIRLQTLNLSAEVENIVNGTTEKTEDSIAYNDGVPVSTVLPEQTLWAEMHKLYSHTDSVVALAATSDGLILASSSKGVNSNECAITIWQTNTWKEMFKIYAHTLTINMLAFSPDNQFLLSVGRDRRWNLFKIRHEGDIKLFGTMDGTDDSDSIHRRALLCCAWSHDGKYFSTGSRDGKLVIWGKRLMQDTAKVNDVNVYTFNADHTSKITSPSVIDSKMLSHFRSRTLKGDQRQFDAVAVFLFDKNVVTSVSFAPDFIGAMKDYYFFAIGFENGLIRYIFWNEQYCSDWTSEISGKFYSQHTKCVNKLVFRPKFGRPGFPDTDNKTLLLASCGMDQLVYINCLEFSDTEIKDDGDHS